jgi:hypothetical protein
MKQVILAALVAAFVLVGCKSTEELVPRCYWLSMIYNTPSVEKVEPVAQHGCWCFIVYTNKSHHVSWAPDKYCGRSEDVQRQEHDDAGVGDQVD